MTNDQEKAIHILSSAIENAVDTSFGSFAGEKEIEKRRDITKAEYELEGEERELMEKIYPDFRKTAWDKMQAYNDCLYILAAREEKLKEDILSNLDIEKLIKLIREA